MADPLANEYELPSDLATLFLDTANSIIDKDKIDLGLDPPPDLVIEADVTSKSLNKFVLFSAMGVPEVWRYDDGQVTIYRLASGAYVETEQSPTFPLLTSEMATQFLAERREMKSTAWLRRVREWAREQLQSPPAE